MTELFLLSLDDRLPPLAMFVRIGYDLLQGAGRLVGVVDHHRLTLGTSNYIQRSLDVMIFSRYHGFAITFASVYADAWGMAVRQSDTMYTSRDTMLKTESRDLFLVALSKHERIFTNRELVWLRT